MPTNSVPQSDVGAKFKERVRKKLSSILRKRYVVVKDNMKYLTHFPPVVRTWKDGRSKKGVDEIRMVYDATKSGLNDAVWAPWFTMPTVDCHLRAVEAGTFMVDCDMGEMFLNFML